MQEADTFFGRRAELAALTAAARQSRVVTICGPAGVGKSALLRRWSALEGHRCVDLTEVPADLPIERYIAAALGVSVNPDASVATSRRALAAVLADMNDVVVIDNAEQHSTALRELVDDALLANCRFIGASRERLRCSDEHMLQLDPFDTVGTASEAAEYLRWRAAQLGPTHSLRDEDAADIAALAGRLDGLPLAIDLAAGRLNLLRPAMLLERLERSSDVLSSAEAGSLHGVLQTSWDAADDAEQAALASLAILNGPFEPMLAEAVIGTDGLTALGRLRDRNLVSMDEDGRLRLLLAVRDFVREKLQEATRTAALERLAAALAARTPEWLDGATRLNPLETVRSLREHEQHLDLVVRQHVGEDSEISACALALAAAAALNGTAQRAYGALTRLNESDGRLGVAAARLAMDLGRLGEARRLLSDATEFDALIEAVQCAQFLGDLDEAATLCERAQALAVSDLERGRAATSLAGVKYHVGQYDEAYRHYELGLRHARRSGDRRTEARVLQNLGVLNCDRLRLDLARKFLEEAIAHHREAGDLLREAWGHNSIGVVELRAHDPDRGIAALERAGELFDLVGHLAGSASTRANLAMIAVDTGRWDDGVRHSLEALERATAEEDPHVTGMSMLCLALSTWLRGDREDAGRHFRDFESKIDRSAHIQLAISWDAAYGAYLAATGDPRSEEVFSHAERQLTDDEGHDVYQTMFRLARCQQQLRELKHGVRPREEVALEIFDALDGVGLTRSEPLRYTLSLLVHEAPDELAATLNAISEASPDTLLVAAEFEAMKPPSGSWMSFGSSPSLWRLFAALAEAARDGLGPLDLDALQETTWPGEFLTTESAANRLHVSLSKLRKAGLKPYLRRDTDGYLLDCDVVFV